MDRIVSLLLGGAVKPVGVNVYLMQNVDMGEIGLL